MTDTPADATPEVPADTTPEGTPESRSSARGAKPRGTRTGSTTPRSTTARAKARTKAGDKARDKAVTGAPSDPTAKPKPEPKTETKTDTDTKITSSARPASPAGSAPERRTSTVTEKDPSMPTSDMTDAVTDRLVETIADTLADSPTGAPRLGRAVSRPVIDDALTGTRPLDSPNKGMVDEHAEMALVAAALIDPEDYYEVAELVDDTDFATPRLAEIWRAVMACERQGRSIDVVTVADELQRAGTLGRIGGVVALDDLVAAGASLSNVNAYAEIVAERSLARKVARCGRELVRHATDPTVVGTDALEYAEQSVFALNHQPTRSDLVLLRDAVPEALERLAGLRHRALPGHPTGFRELDRITGGVQGGQLIIVAARPGMGKSSFALTVARNIAETSGDTVVFLSYEMSRHELACRLFASALKVSLGTLRQGLLPNEMEDDLAAAVERLKRIPLQLSETPPPTVAGLRAAMRRVARRQPLAAIVVDYLQLMSGERRGGDANRVQEVSEISRGLKMLSRELDVPVIALSQLSRAVEQRAVKIPQLSDLRDSGSIEQDADTVWFLAREVTPLPGEDPEDATLVVAKQRQGEAGAHIPLRFVASAAAFEDRPEGYRAAAAAAPRPMPRGNAPF